MVILRQWGLLVRIVVLLAFALPHFSPAQLAMAQGTELDRDDEIVYLEPNGVIRVFDPTPPAGGLQVEWFSPTCGWSALTLADVTDDGDVEIIAIKQERDGGRLTIFD